MQKHIPLLFCALFLVVVSTTGAYAQRMRMSPQERVAALKDSLGLSDDQTAKITSIFEDMGKQRQAIFDSTDDRDARRQAMMSLSAKADTLIESVLTDQQKAKYEAMEKERQERMQQYRNRQN
jgi:periplasmic protein CpxP/Spy